MNPSIGIPGGPQSQFIHFNNQINTIVTKDNFGLKDENIYIQNLNFSNDKNEL